MYINDLVLNSSEKVIFALRDLYLNSGFVPYRMGKFEEYDLYAGHKDFLASESVITFTDTNGKLMALKPDVTLSIVKNTPDEPDSIKKVFYNENVYRISKGTGSYKEIMQFGVESIGDVNQDRLCEVIALAVKSLEQISDTSILAISDIDVIGEVIGNLTSSSDIRKQLYKAVEEKRLHDIDALLGDEEKGKLLKRLLLVHGNIRECLPRLDELLKEISSYSAFREVINKLSDDNIAERIYIDFSVVDDINYYNGIVFKGYIKNIPVTVLSGGQYDNLMKRMGRSSKAIGFAVYTDEFDRFEPQKEEAITDDGYINIALPKGRLGDKVYKLFAEAGYDCPSILEENRKLIFENPLKRLRYFWVKPSDVAIYVERGAADIGVAGKDILLEYTPDIYELLDLKMGKCKMAVAAPRNFKDDPSAPLIVATKFAKIAGDYYQSCGRDIDMIHLNGSIELAPILGLSDVIVDIVETGTTLKENNLVVFEDVCPISARLIANKSSFRFKNEAIKKIGRSLDKVIRDKEK